MGMHSHRRRIRAPGVSRTAMLIALSLTFVSCDFADPLAEYRGVDIIASRGMTMTGGGPGYLAGPLPDNGFEYVVLEELGPAEYGTSAGLPDGARVYRLENPNLLPDGDFEETAPGPGMVPPRWEIEGIPLFEVVDEGTPHLVTGNHLSFTIGSPTELARIDLGTHLADELVGTGIYHIQFDIVRRAADSSLMLDFGEGSMSYLALNTSDWIFLTDGSPPRLEPFPRRDGTLFDRPGTFYANAAGTGFLYVGSPYQSGASDGHLDNIRIGRLDVLPHWALPLTTDSETGLDLIPGAYRIRLFVKSELDDQVTPNAPNRFRSGSISLGANNRFATFSATQSGWSATQWVELIHEITLSADDLTATPALTLQLSPSGPDRPAVGSILISSPVLELFQ